MAGVKNIEYYRTVQLDLKKWYRSAKRKVIKISGGRYVGKTTEIKKFARENFNQVIYIDLRDEAIKELFYKTIKQGVNPTSIKNYCKESGLPAFLNKWSTIIVVDHLYEDSEIYRMVVDGRKALVSCVAVVLEPTNYLPDRDSCREELTYPIKMYPLGYFEVVDTAARNDLGYVPIRTFERIGGYPEIVKLYFETGDVEACYNKLLIMIDELVGSIDFEKIIGYKLFELWDLTINNVERGYVRPIGPPEGLRELNYEDIVHNSKYDEGVVNKLLNNGILEKIANGDVIIFTDSGIESYMMNRYGVSHPITICIVRNDIVHKDYYT